MINKHEPQICCRVCFHRERNVAKSPMVLDKFCLAFALLIMIVFSMNQSGWLDTQLQYTYHPTQTTRCSWQTSHISHSWYTKDTSWHTKHFPKPQLDTTPHPTTATHSTHLKAHQTHLTAHSTPHCCYTHLTTQKHSIFWCVCYCLVWPSLVQVESPCFTVVFITRNLKTHREITKKSWGTDVWNEISKTE